MKVANSKILILLITVGSFLASCKPVDKKDLDEKNPVIVQKLSSDQISIFEQTLTAIGRIESAVAQANGSENPPVTDALTDQLTEIISGNGCSSAYKKAEGTSVGPQDAHVYISGQTCPLQAKMDIAVTFDERKHSREVDMKAEMKISAQDLKQMNDISKFDLVGHGSTYGDSIEGRSFFAITGTIQSEAHGTIQIKISRQINYRTAAGLRYTTGVQRMDLNFPKNTKTVTVDNKQEIKPDPFQVVLFKNIKVDGKVDRSNYTGSNPPLEKEGFDTAIRTLGMLIP